MIRKINKAGLDLIKHFEGFYDKAYLCPAGVWTIGYGHTKGVKQGQTITKNEAEELLQEDLASAQSAVKRYISVPLSDNQFAALVSFTFNLGAGSLKTSTLRRRLNGGDYDAVPSELARWVKAGGKTLAGLVRRRADEGKLFMKPVDVGADDESLLMPQMVASINDNDNNFITKSYLGSDIDLEQGSVDDQGDTTYVRLSQNVPDGYVFDLQTDLRSLGFSETGTPDGAFGRKTREAVEAFQKMAKIKETGVVGHDTKSSIVLWIERGYSKTLPPNSDVPTPVTLSNGLSLIMPQVPHFSQGDPRWAERTLGRGSSIRREGCAITCVAMILNFFGRNVTPGILDAYLDTNNGYAGNSVKWLVAGQCGGSDTGHELTYSSVTGDSNERNRILLERIERNLPTIVRVDYNIDTNLTYNHFVLCVGKTGDNDFIMNDPATKNGNGYNNPTDENIIGKTSRKGGYNIVRLDWYDPK